MLVLTDIYWRVEDGVQAHRALEILFHVPVPLWEFHPCFSHRVETGPDQDQQSAGGIKSKDVK